MESQQRTETYRGHELHVEAWQERANAWSWSYLIDGKVAGGGAKPMLDAESALRRGMLAARLRADELG